MDGLPTMTAIRTMFAAPLHVRVPKLLKSRDDWKRKALHRRQLVKLTKLTVRDLTRGRDAWRDQVQQLQHRLQQQAEQLELLRRERDQAVAEAATAAQKKSIPSPPGRPAAASIPSPSSPCPSNSSSTPAVPRAAAPP